MATDKQKITLVRGEHKTIQFTVMDSAKQPVDLTDASVYFSVKRCMSDLERAIYKRNTAGGGDNDQAVILTQSGSTKGKYQAFVVPDDTKYVDPDEYKYEAWVKLANGKQYVIVHAGEFVIEAGDPP